MMTIHTLGNGLRCKFSAACLLFHVGVKPVGPAITGVIAIYDLSMYMASDGGAWTMRSAVASGR
eukprot:6178160-Pleurochrysis_carterae.AAC.1